MSDFDREYPANSGDLGIQGRQRSCASWRGFQFCRRHSWDLVSVVTFLPVQYKLRIYHEFG